MELRQHMSNSNNQFSLINFFETFFILLPFRNNRYVTEDNVTTPSQHKKISDIETKMPFFAAK